MCQRLFSFCSKVKDCRHYKQKCRLISIDEIAKGNKFSLVIKPNDISQKAKNVVTLHKSEVLIFVQGDDKFLVLIWRKPLFKPFFIVLGYLWKQGLF